MRTMKKKLLHLLIGALGGLSATGPMTVMMERWHRRLPAKDRHALPPREITNELEEKATGDESQGEGKDSVVLINHFAYGAAAGMVYAGLVGGKKGWGIPFGLMVWVVSYLGLLPMLSLLRPATEHSARRNLLMAGVHVVWGAMLELFVREMIRERREESGALVTESGKPDRDRE